MEPFVTIAISRNTRDRLKELGKKGETYDDLIMQLIIVRSKVSQNSHDRRIGGLQSSEFTST
jgi:hypothetical protein